MLFRSRARNWHYQNDRNAQGASANAGQFSQNQEQSQPAQQEQNSNSANFHQRDAGANHYIAYRCSSVQPRSDITRSENFFLGGRDSRLQSVPPTNRPHSENSSQVYKLTQEDACEWWSATNEERRHMVFPIIIEHTFVPHAIIDPGAHRTIIDEDLFQEICRNALEARKDVGTPLFDLIKWQNPEPMHGIGPEPLTIANVFCAKIKICGITISHPIIAIKGTGGRVLIGNDILDPHGAILDFSKGQRRLKFTKKWCRVCERMFLSDKSKEIGRAHV